MKQFHHTHQTKMNSDLIIDCLPHWLPRLSIRGRAARFVIPTLDAGRLICVSAPGLCRSVSPLRSSVGITNRRLGIHPEHRLCPPAGEERPHGPGERVNGVSIFVVTVCPPPLTLHKTTLKLQQHPDHRGSLLCSHGNRSLYITGDQKGIYYGRRGCGGCS